MKKVNNNEKVNIAKNAQNNVQDNAQNKAQKSGKCSRAKNCK